MTTMRPLQSEISGYISTLLRTHFGKGPTSTFVTITRPFVTIHLRGFLAPTEKVLMDQNETRRILETRDLLMKELKQEIKLNFWKIAELDVQEVYADWHLETKTGLIIVVLDESHEPERMEWPSDVDERGMYEEVAAASARGQKEPEHTEVFWLNERTVLVRRFGILIQLEKELIKNGFEEELKIAKRPLEYKLVYHSKFEEILKRQIHEVFVDWNFKEDIGYMILTLPPKEAEENKAGNLRK